MRKVYRLILEYGLIIIISIPAFTSLLNPYFFTMHDSQQTARLFVLTEALSQGSIYPRWVDVFGFNYGYPLFNFYPPLIYYVGAFFHLLGFSILWSVKMVVIAGYILAAVGMYMFVKKLLNNRPAAYLASVLYTYFTYHAINAYVRGAMAEFFSMTVLPFVFLSLETLRRDTSIKNAFFFSITFGLLILTHPLIAFPAMLFIGAYMLHSLVLHTNKIKYTLHAALGIAFGLLMSAFFWLPSMIERKFTLVDSILLKELASYTIHFVFPDQLWFSAWGYGGSGAGYADGMSFQLGKVHIAIAIFALVMCLIAIAFKRRLPIDRPKTLFNDFGFFVLFGAGAIFMMISQSEFLWNLISFLQYLQFPWRFMTFIGLFISVIGAYGIYFATSLLKGKHAMIAAIALVIIMSIGTIATYQKYFKPQEYMKVSDKQLTSFDEIAWRVSRTSFEFVPKGVKTKNSEYGTTVLAIDKKDLNRSQFDVKNGTAKVTPIKTVYDEKVFDIDTASGAQFTLHTYNFPGWMAYLDGTKTKISDSNDLKLITVSMPAGKHQLRFVFEDTPVRTIANTLSLVSIILITSSFFINFKKRT